MLTCVHVSIFFLSLFSIILCHLITFTSKSIFQMFYVENHSRDHKSLIHLDLTYYYHILQKLFRLLDLFLKSFFKINCCCCCC